MSAETSQDFQEEAGHLGYLYDRWQDESQYEPWSEYQDYMRMRVPREAQNFTMNEVGAQQDIVVSFVLNGKTVTMKAAAESVTVIVL